MSPSIICLIKIVGYNPSIGFPARSALDDCTCMLIRKWTNILVAFRNGISQMLLSKNRRARRPNYYFELLPIKNTPINTNAIPIHSIQSASLICISFHNSPCESREWQKEKAMFPQPPLFGRRFLSLPGDNFVHEFSSD